MTPKNAEGIVKTLVETFQDNNIDARKLLSIATDCASVVAGKNIGVCRRLALLFNPFQTVNQCIAHRAALAGENATEKVSLQRKWTAMQEVVNFYAHSTNRAGTLEKIREELGRNRLNATLLDDLMMINLNGPMMINLNTPEMSQLLD